MKKIIIALLVVLGSFTAEAQTTTAKPNAKQAAKLEVKWETDINVAIKLSNKSKKPMLLFFTGSDWCGWCVRLQKEVFKTPEFAKWAKANVVLVEIDFPRNTEQTEALKAQNNGLQQSFGIQGYPTIWFASAKMQKDGKPNFTGIGNTGYVAGGPTAWLEVADSILKSK